MKWKPTLSAWNLIFITSCQQMSKFRIPEPHLDGQRVKTFSMRDDDACASNVVQNISIVVSHILPCEAMTVCSIHRKSLQMQTQDRDLPKRRNIYLKKARAPIKADEHRWSRNGGETLVPAGRHTGGERAASRACSPAGVGSDRP